MNDSNAPAWNGVRELWNSVHEVLKSVNTDPLVIALVKERFYPSILGFPRPRTKGFKAAVLPYLTSRKAVSRTEYYKLTYTTGLVIRDDREYRVVSQLPANDKGERVEVLLVTPPGQDTLALKNDLFDRGWDAFYAAHEDFEFYKVADLEKADFNPESPPTERALMFEHHYDIGLYRKSHMYLPKDNIMVAKIPVSFAPLNKLLLGRLNGGFKRGELITITGHLVPRPLSRESVEFIEGCLERRNA